MVFRKAALSSSEGVETLLTRSYTTLMNLPLKALICSDHAHSIVIKDCTKMSNVNKGFLPQHFDNDLFAEIVRSISPRAECVDFKQVPFSSKEGISSKLTDNASDDARVLGFRAFDVRYRNTDDEVKTCRVVFKIKPKYTETWETVIKAVGKMGDDRTGEDYAKRTFDNHYGIDTKELAVVAVEEPVWRAIMPDIYWSRRDDEREIYAFAMENLRHSATHMDTGDDVSCWKEDDVVCVLQEIAAFHSVYYGQTELLPEAVKQSLTDIGTMTQTYTDDIMKKFMRRQLEENIKTYPELLTPQIIRIIEESLMNVKNVCAILDGSPHTLTHNDFNQRNLCLRQTPVPRGKSRLCAYDWEFIRVTNPQHDVAEFLAFVLPANTEPEAWLPYLEAYRQALLQQLRNRNAPSDVQASVEDQDRFKQVFDMCVLELVLNRLGTYMRIHAVLHPMGYLSRIAGNLLRYAEDMTALYDFMLS